MTDLGVSRKLDELGRVVLPMELRHALNLEMGDELRILLDEERQTLLLKKRGAECAYCYGTEELKTLPDGKMICAACFAKVQ